MKISILVFLIIVSISAANVGAIPTTDSLNWTMYDDFADGTSHDNWTQQGIIYNMSTDFGLDGKMVLRSESFMGWIAASHYYAAMPENDLRGIKANISIKRTQGYTLFGYGRNVVGVQVAPNLDVYMGFFSDGYSHTIQVGYRLDGQDVIRLVNSDSGIGAGL